MRNIPHKTAFTLIQKMKREIEETQPSTQLMIDEIKMMRFKIRSVQGDIDFLTKKNHGFITALWKIGKIDEIVSIEAQQLDEEEKKIFFNYIESQQYNMQKELHVNLPATSHTSQNQVAILEIEIVKERKINNKTLN